MNKIYHIGKRLPDGYFQFNLQLSFFMMIKFLKTHNNSYFGIEFDMETKKVRLYE